ncbi:MAG: enoyl-CoA hydratase/isomerase family protein [Thermoanaerobaculia bacterium]
MSNVLLEVHDSIATVTLARGKVNAINGDVVADLDLTFRALESRADVRAIVLTGRGKFFSFGYDVPELLSYSKEQFVTFVRKFTELYTYLFVYPKPVIAALNGHAVAGGCMLALTCDRRIMIDGHANIALNEIAFGSTLFAGSVEMLRFCTGDRAAAEILYTGAMYSGADALQIGLVDDVRADFAERALAVARELGQRNPPAFASIKTMLRGPVAEQMRAREETSIQEMADIWYSDHTWANLKYIAIR